jgi:hypothetical protein
LSISSSFDTTTTSNARGVSARNRSVRGREFNNFSCVTTHSVVVAVVVALRAVVVVAFCVVIARSIARVAARTALRARISAVAFASIRPFATRVRRRRASDASPPCRRAR